jgi:hypothetical protein
MKAIIWKEFRENLKWGVLLLLGSAYGIITLQALELDQVVLFNSEYLIFATFCFPAGALALGLLQTVFEGSRDRWAYLVHRGVSPERILAAKAVAGLTYLLIATVVPLVGMAWWCSRPGNVAAPWHPIAPLAGVIAIFAALPAWFAGVLIGLRDVRWYGSRFLPAGLGLLPMMAVLMFGQFWIVPQMLWTIPLSLAVTAVYAVAAVGVVRHRGAYAPQPVITRWCLTLTTACGAFILMCVLVTMTYEGLRELSSDLRRNRITSCYFVTEEGRLLKFERPAAGSAVKVTDPATGKTIPYPNNSEPHGPIGFWLAPEQVQLRPRESGQFPEAFVRTRGISTAGASVWYYLSEQGVFAGYNRGTRKRVLTIGPDGWTEPGTAPQRRFRGMPRRIGNNQQFFSGSTYEDREFPQLHSINWSNTVVFDDGIYRIFPHDGRVTKAYSAPDDNPITSVTSVSGFRELSVWVVHRRLARKFVFTSADIDAANLDVASDVNAQLSENHLAYEIRFPDGLPDLGPEVIDLPDVEQVAYRWWILNGTRGDEMRQCTVIAKRDGTILRQVVHDIPVNASSTFNEMRYVTLVLPPVLTEVVSRLATRESTAPISGVATERYVTERSLASLYLMWGSSLVSAGLIVLLARRRNLSKGSTIRWSLACLVFGPAAVITLLSLRARPQSGICTTCSRRRPMTINECPHCGSTVPPPVTDGTEIFVSPTRLASRSDSNAAPAAVPSVS